MGAFDTVGKPPLSSIVKPLKRGKTSRSEFVAIEPGYNADKIDSSSGSDVLEMRSGQSDVTRTAHAKGTDSLRHRRFDAGANGVLLGERFRMLPFSRCLQSLVLLLRSNRQ